MRASEVAKEIKKRLSRFINLSDNTHPDFIVKDVKSRTRWQLIIKLENGASYQVDVMLLERPKNKK